MEHFYDDIVTQLRNNLKKIIFLYEKEKNTNTELNNKIEILNKSIVTLRKEKEEILIQFENNKIAKAFIDASGNNHEAKIKVNRIVREIDKCIALLNK